MKAVLRFVAIDLSSFVVAFAVAFFLFDHFLIAPALESLVQQCAVVQP